MVLFITTTVRTSNPTTGKKLEGSGCGLIEIKSKHFPGGTEKNNKNSQSR
jgi:hypothetical protein